MKFQDILNNYIENLGCSIRELSDASGLSASVISRYRSGERTPGEDSEQLKNLANGIVYLAKVNPAAKADITYDGVLSDFQKTLRPDHDLSKFASKFDFIIVELNINVSAMAKALNYDASFLSRIRSASRMPSDVTVFVQKFTDYLLTNYPAEKLLALTKRESDNAEHVDTKEISGDVSPEVLRKILETFLLNAELHLHNQTSDFLHKLDAFDLNEYIRAIHFDELKVPSVPFQFHTSRAYRGVDGQKKGELDFLKGTVLSKSADPVFLCSDMDMDDMADDVEFSKQWMFGLAMILKRNMKINIIHNLNRPWSELMLGLEAWIPLYMTGQVTPYYLKGTHNEFYQHILYTSGTYALSGECIKGSHDKAKYLLTNAKDDVAYYKDRSAAILKKAYPLMDIFTQDDKKSLDQFIRNSAAENVNRHYIFSCLPAFALSEEILSNILEREHADKHHAAILFDRIREKTRDIEDFLENNTLLMEIPYITEEEFLQHPPVVDLAICYDHFSSVTYSYEEYSEHLKALRQYAEAHENFVLKLRKDFAFRNIQIRIAEGKWVWISKVNSPAIHFVIRHPKLRDAIENMYIPIYEQTS